MLAFPLSMDLMTRLDFPFGVIGLVHVENEIEQLRPVDGGRALRRRACARPTCATTSAGGSSTCVAEAEVGGEHRLALAVDLPAPRGRRRRGLEVVERSEPPEASAIWQVPGDQGRRYAGVSGDNNPIHLYPLTARLFGFPKPIAHGMWVKARCLAALEGHLPDAFTVNVRFKLPMLLPAKAAFSPADADGVRRARRAQRQAARVRHRDLSHTKALQTGLPWRRSPPRKE